MIEEVWKKIEEAPYYSVSNFGRVRMDGRTYINSRGAARTCNPHMVGVSKKKNTGYLEVRLIIDKNKYIYRTVHRLVLSTFNPIENMSAMEVNHKDENKNNNRLENLEWVTSQENCNYGTRNLKCGEAKSKKVRCVETGVIYNSGKEASEHTKATRSGISNCINGKKKRSGGFHWEEVV